jgi:hypothetical protein
MGCGGREISWQLAINRKTDDKYTTPGILLAIYIHPAGRKKTSSAELVGQTGHLFYYYLKTARLPRKTQSSYPMEIQNKTDRPVFFFCFHPTAQREKCKL